MAQGTQDRSPMTEKQMRDLVECVVSDSIKQERARIGEIAAFSIDRFLQYCKANRLDPMGMTPTDLVIFITGMAFESIPDICPQENVM